MFGSPAYPSYRIFLATAIAAAVSIVLMPFFIKLMHHEQLGQQIRADGPGTHLVKQGTPTMGGIIILLAALVATAIQAQWTPGLRLAVIATLLTGSLGLLDDIESVAHKRSLGLTPGQKMLGLALISLSFCTIATNFCYVRPTVEFPGGFTVDLGVVTSHFLIFGKWIHFPWLYLIFVFLLMAGLSNAVNLTDGLDGLAGGCSMVVFLIMAMVAFSYNEANLAVFAGSLAGAIVGFLWYNCYPAQIFMGDTGSLGLGAAFAALAVLTKTELSSLVMGGLFIVEALSVMIQVASFKLTGKRVFLMAPLHHHFEKKGWSETKVVIRFWIVSAAFAALGFALYFQLR
ncbi:phospho-N-acetylmuramoyl-pentapeptide-transferase [Olegusella massiliensis]|uniref:phospho-N-acetylmuramoyl-pentapeptide- transferase n=1 Tax=Olegusella massiliensis TaxID=1776381 RepID=UPI0003AE03EE|nr:phospho-N-acetylmuramoyl-pentapeptide-transferase [Olegusella massiliensis]ERL12675.1 phospho-N-acetylmuramoyl-pentapeptide-transferase [Coriobacteriaceae bacterium BV3Ac1]MBS5865405.1 phospho-N-acetylmuramoyl-pentapeptide-transferase [Coriobacteriaceae bacterium]